MSGGDRLLFAFGLGALLVYAITYWSLQPTCAPGEVRVRGVFMTRCIIGH